MKIKIKHFIAILIFLILIWTPFLVMLLKPKVLEVGFDQRELQQLPTFNREEPEKFVKDFENFFNDHIGLRKTLISLHNNLNTKLFNESPTKAVVIGKNGWLYFSAGIRGKFDKAKYSSKQIATESAVLAKQYDDLHKEGIFFISLVVPNKHTIYPENLPSYYPKKLVVSPRFDQRLNNLKEKYNINEIDLRPEFFNQKRNHQLYYKTDSHWNNFGSFIAYQEIMKKISRNFKEVTPMELDDFKIIENEREVPTDMYKLLGVSTELNDSEVKLILKDEKRAELKNKKINTLVIYHDSFFDPVEHWSPVNLLKEHFETVITRRNTEKIDMNMIKQAKADVVIYEIVERNI